MLLNKFKPIFEELDQFLNTYDLSVIYGIKQEQIDTILEDLFPHKLGTEQVSVITDYRKNKYTVSCYILTTDEAVQILEQVRELGIPFKIN